MTIDSERRSWLEQTLRLLVGRPFISTLIFILFGASLGVWGAGIHITGDMEALFPDNTPTVTRARAARAVVGSRDQLQIFFGGETRELNIAVATEVAEKLRLMSDDVQSVELRRETAFFEKNALLYVSLADVKQLEREVSETIKQAVAKDMGLDDFDLDDSNSAEPKERSRLPTESELRQRYDARDLTEYFETPDGHVILLKVYPTFKPANTGRAQVLFAAAQTILDEAIAKHAPDQVEAAMYGPYTDVSSTIGQITRDLGRSTGAALLVIAIILVGYFRRVRAVTVVLFPLIIGLLMSLAFARAAIGELNMITAFIFAILVGLGIDFSVHAVSRVKEVRREGYALQEAIPRALTTLGSAMGAAAITTIATFLALTLFEFRGFSHFGLIAAAGIALCLLSVYVLVPGLEMTFDKVRPKPVDTNPEPDVPPPAQFSRSAAWSILCVVSLVMATAVLGLPALGFDDDNDKMRMERGSNTVGFVSKYRREADTRGVSPALALTSGLEETEALHRHLAQFKDKSSLLEDVVSLYSFVPEEQQEKAAVISEIKRKVKNKYGLLEGQDRQDADRLLTYLEPTPFNVHGLPDWVKAKFTDTQGNLGRYVLLYLHGPKAQARVVLQLRDAYGEIQLDGQTFYTTAPWMISGDMFATVQREGPIAVGSAALVVFIILLLTIRHLGFVLLAYLPLVSGFIIFLGILGWAEIYFNLFNVVVLPIVFGIGVDTAIHLVHRLREGATVYETLRTTGAAAAVSSVTTAVGFASLLLVGNAGLRSIGWVAVTGIITTYLITTVLIAVFAVLFGPKLGLSTTANQPCAN